MRFHNCPIYRRCWGSEAPSQEIMTYRAPAFQIYAAEYLADFDIRMLRPAQRGVLLDLWCVCWRDGSIPDNPVKLSALCGLKLEVFKHLWSGVRAFFRPGDAGHLVSNRLQKQQRDLNAFHRSRVSAGRKGGKAHAAKKVTAEAQLEPSSSSATAKPKPSSLTLSSTASKSKTTTRPAGAALARRTGPEILLELQEQATQELGEAHARSLVAELWFAYWKLRRNHPRSLWSTDRLKLITKTLLANGDDISELFYVVDGAHQDPWANGTDPRAHHVNDDPNILLRDRDHIERFAGLCAGWRNHTPHPMAVKYGLTRTNGAAHAAESHAGKGRPGHLRPATDRPGGE